MGAPLLAGWDSASEASRRFETVLRGSGFPPPLHDAESLERVSVRVRMRDGVALATNLTLPPRRPAPVLVLRTPYGRATEALVAAASAFAQAGYAFVAQDTRGTGESEPAHWDYYVFEEQDGFDLVEWIVSQPWCDGFVCSGGGSYAGQTQWCMATHPAMGAIAPHVSGLGIATNTAHLHLFLDAYVRSIGHGAEFDGQPFFAIEKRFLSETLASGLYQAPLHPKWPAAVLDMVPALRTLPPNQQRAALWQHYAALPAPDRADFIRTLFGRREVDMLAIELLSDLFGPTVPHDAHALPRSSTRDLAQSLHAVPLIRTAWYDWALNDALASWCLIRDQARPEIADQARLLIAPQSHMTWGYREGADADPCLGAEPTFASTAPLLHLWCDTVRRSAVVDWPRVIFYLMGANEWRYAVDWPIPGATSYRLYLRSGGELSADPPLEADAPCEYVYDPFDPTPTCGGSIVSTVYDAGSLDLSEVQCRDDVLCYTSEVLPHDLDMVGPLLMTLYACSSARDTDFIARLSDVFPDGRALHIQSGILRARYRDPEAPAFLEPDHIHCLRIDMWATANRFRAGHRIRLEIASADFPRFDRNSNLAEGEGVGVLARQTIYHDADHPSHLEAWTIPVVPA